MKTLILILAAMVVSTSLTACSSPGDTTCGEYKDMSDSERFDVLKQEIDDKGTDDGPDIEFEPERLGLMARSTQL